MAICFKCHCAQPYISDEWNTVDELIGKNCTTVGCTGSMLCPYRCRYMSCYSRDIITKWCSGCRKVRYCSKKCQKQDWKFHKVLCHVETKEEKRKQTLNPLNPDLCHVEETRKQTLNPVETKEETKDSDLHSVGVDLLNQLDRYDKLERSRSFFRAKELRAKCSMCGLIVTFGERCCGRYAMNVFKSKKERQESLRLDKEKQRVEKEQESLRLAKEKQRQESLRLSMESELIIGDLIGEFSDSES